jgi:hypothetical protein
MVRAVATYLTSEYETAADLPRLPGKLAGTMKIVRLRQSSLSRILR